MGTKKKATVTVDVPAGVDDLGAAFPMLGQFAREVAWLNTLAQGGYAEAALARVGLYAKYLRSGDPMPTGDFLRLCSWLDEIAGGKDPSKVFGLKKEARGISPSMAKLETMGKIAFHVFTLRNGGASLENAIADAATQFKCAEPTARRAWEVFGKSLQDLKTKYEQSPPDLSPLKNKRPKRDSKNIGGSQRKMKR